MLKLNPKEAWCKTVPEISFKVDVEDSLVPFFGLNHLYTHHVRLWWDWGQRFWREVDSHGVLRDGSLLQVDLICWSNCSTPGDGWTGRWLAWRSWTNAAFAGSKIAVWSRGRALSNLKGHIFTGFSLEINWFGTFVPWKVPKENAQGMGRRKPVELKEFGELPCFFWVHDLMMSFFGTQGLNVCLWFKNKDPEKSVQIQRQRWRASFFSWFCEQSIKSPDKQQVWFESRFSLGVICSALGCCEKWNEAMLRPRGNGAHFFKFSPPVGAAMLESVQILAGWSCWNTWVHWYVYIYTHSIYIYLYFPMNQTWCIFFSSQRYPMTPVYLLQSIVVLMETSTFRTSRPCRISRCGRGNCLWCLCVPNENMHKTLLK